MNSGRVAAFAVPIVSSDRLWAGLGEILVYARYLQALNPMFPAELNFRFLFGETHTFWRVIPPDLDAALRC